MEKWRAACKERKANEKAAAEAREAVRVAWRDACEWRPIAEYPTYEVNADGRVRNIETGNIIAVREKKGYTFSRIGGRNGQTFSTSTLAQVFINGSIAKAQETFGASRQAEGNRDNWARQWAATHAKVLDAWNRGLNAKQIREELGVGEMTVYRHLKVEGISAQQRIRDMEAAKREEETAAKAAAKLYAETFRDMKGEQLELFPKTCPTCGRPMPGGSTAKYCCEECRPSHYFAQKDIEHICIGCGAHYFYSKEDDSSFTRCPDCQKEHKRELRRQSVQYGKTLNARGRWWTRQTGAAYEPIDPDVVFERDGGICYICHEPTKERDGEWAPDYPTCDHVEPLSKGGAHTYDNIRLACWRCNTEKGADLYEEVLSHEQYRIESLQGEAS